MNMCINYVYKQRITCTAAKQSVQSTDTSQKKTGLYLKNIECKLENGRSILNRNTINYYTDSNHV